MEKYLTVDGRDISDNADFSHLKLEYVLQRFRDVWIVLPEYPYLAIDADRVRKHLEESQKFIVFSSSILYQNLSREEFGQRLLASFACNDPAEFAH